VLTNPEGKNHLQDLDIEDSVLLKWILQTRMPTNGLVWLTTGTSGGAILNMIMKFRVIFLEKFLVSWGGGGLIPSRRILLQEVSQSVSQLAS
jgi:hypothetical protein